MRPDSIHHAGALVPGADRQGYIPALDGFRAVAISLVLLFHASLNAENTHSALFARTATLFARIGPFGVLIFFAISGYLITGRIVAEHEKTGRFSLAEFYWKRGFRILPLAYLYLSLIAVLGLLGVVHLTRGDFSAPFFVTNYVPSRSLYTAHWWSLSVEEHFYLFWPPSSRC